MKLSRDPNKLKLFISYSRQDFAVADALVEALLLHNFDVTIDRRDLEFGEKWQQELAEFIRLSDTVIWLVSEASLQSEWVNWELDEVSRRGKRLVPLLVGPTQKETLPRKLGAIHILPAIGLFDISIHLDTLVRVLETDQAWLKESSRLADRAHEWHTNGRITGLLLSPTSLAVAESWKDRKPTKAPTPVAEVLEFLLASRQVANRRQRQWLIGVIAIACTAVGGAWYANQQRLATVQLRQQTQSTESGLLSNAANELVDNDLGRDTATAMLLALEALPDQSTGIERPYVAEAEFQLDRALRKKRELSILSGHTDSVTHVSWSPDNKRIITSSNDNTARIWDVSSGIQLLVLEGHTGSVTKAEWNFDGSQVVTASRDASAIVWDSVSGKRLVTFTDHTGGVTDVSWEINGRRIATASADNTARIWSADTGRELVTLNGHNQDVLRVRWRPGNSIVSTAAADTTTRIWDANTGRELRKIQGSGWNLFTDWAPDGNSLLVHWMHNLRVLNISSDDQALVLNHADWVYDAAWSHSGSKVASGSRDGTVAVWVASTGAQSSRFLGHKDEVTNVSWSPNDEFLLSTSKDGTARVWDVGLAKEVVRLELHMGRLDFASWSRDGQHIATVSVDGTVRIWRAVPAVEYSVLPHRDSRTGNMIRTLSKSPDGRRLLTATATRHFAAGIQILDALTFEEMVNTSIREDFMNWSLDSQRFATASESNVSIWSVLPGKVQHRFDLNHTGAVYSAQWSPDSTRIISTSYDGKKAQTISREFADAGWSIHLWNDATGDQIWELPTRTSGAIDWSPDSTKFVTTSSHAHIWDAKSGKEIARLMHPEGGNPIVAKWSPNGKKIVTFGNSGSYEDSSARIWDAATGKEYVELNGQYRGIWRAEWSRDGSRLFTLSATGVQIWSADSGNLIGRVQDKGLSKVGWFSNDATRLIGLKGPTVSIYEASGGVEVIRLGGHDSEVKDAVWIPNLIMGSAGKVITVTVRGSARVWEAFSTTQDIVEAAKGQSPRCLSRMQRKYFFLPESPPRWCRERQLWPYSKLR